jgi:hypothetical protein
MRSAVLLFVALCAAAGPAGAAEVTCDDRLDDDVDGLVDCVDPDCVGHPACADFDSDGDGALNDSDCAPLDPGAIQVPGGAAVRVARVPGTAATVRVSWNDLRSSAGSGVRALVGRGPLTDLRAGLGFAGMQALATASDALELDDAGGGAGGSYYLVRLDNPCGDGPGWPLADTDCTNGIDDDLDGLVDCDDLSCASHPACCVPSSCVAPEVTLFPSATCQTWVLDAACGPRFAAVSLGTSARCVFTTCLCGGQAVTDVLLRLDAPDCLTPVAVNHDTCGIGPHLAFQPGAAGAFVLEVRSVIAGGRVACTVAYFLEEPDCSDGLDNDGDGDVDCADSDCAGIPPC